MLPPAGTYERWAWDYVHAPSLEAKLAPPPRDLDWEEPPRSRREMRPSRPGLRVVARAPKAPAMGALRSPRRRAELMHTFFHHELQAAELMCWALLAFAGAPRAFRQGLLAICGDEVRHMHLYRRQLRRLGCEVGDFPVRDWFWQRVPSCPDAASFTATMGMGLEAANLDHALRYEAWLRAAGDDEAADVQRRIGREEVAHVRFGVEWFSKLAGEADGGRAAGGSGTELARWASRLPPPLSPLLMRGRPLDRDGRLAAGMSPELIDAIEAWQPVERR